MIYKNTHNVQKNIEIYLSILHKNAMDIKNNIKLLIYNIINEFSY
jgi:hypothetical protein